MSSSLEQQIADWFRARLSTLNQVNGYSFNLTPESIFTDGGIPQDRSVPVPYAAYDDDDGLWEDVNPNDKASIKVMSPVVYVMVPAKYETYRKTSRTVFRDIATACRIDLMEDTDLPTGVLAVTPESWARNDRDGRYVEIAITFTVKAASSFVTPT
jgi:hypothetical protein